MLNRYHHHWRLLFLCIVTVNVVGYVRLSNSAWREESLRRFLLQLPIAFTQFSSYARKQWPATNLELINSRHLVTRVNQLSVSDSISILSWIHCSLLAGASNPVDYKRIMTVNYLTSTNLKICLVFVSSYFFFLFLPPTLLR